MNNERIEEYDDERVEQLMENETVEVGGVESTLGELMGDIQQAHTALDEYKSGSLSLSQNLSEAADRSRDEVMTAILQDMSDGAFTAYLRLQRGDLELVGKRDGEYSGFLAE